MIVFFKVPLPLRWLIFFGPFAVMLGVDRKGFSSLNNQALLFHIFLVLLRKNVDGKGEDFATRDAHLRFLC